METGGAGKLSPNRCIIELQSSSPADQFDLQT
jgi:hypothetical protein